MPSSTASKRRTSSGMEQRRGSCHCPKTIRLSYGRRCKSVWLAETAWHMAGKLTHGITRQAFVVRSDSPEAALCSRRPAAPYSPQSLPSFLAVRFRAFDRPFEGCPVAHHALLARGQRSANAGDGPTYPSARIVPKSQDTDTCKTCLTRCSGSSELSGRRTSQGGSVFGRMVAPRSGDDVLR